LINSFVGENKSAVDHDQVIITPLKFFCNLLIILIT